MRKRTKHRVPSAVQNLVIVCLIFSALFLLLRTGLVRTEALNQVFSTVSQGTSMVPERTASMQLPVHIAVRTGGECRAWMSETTTGNIFDDFGPLLTEALGSASSESTASEEEFRRALENSCVYFDFTATLPLTLLEHCLGSSGGAPQISARALLLSSGQNSTLVLYAWDQNSDLYYRWSTSIPADNLQTAADKHTGNSAEFAFLSDAPYNTLMPYTLICQDRLVLSELTAATNLDDTAKDTLLTQLEFNIHSTSRYTESNGAEIVGQGTRTLRIAPDGTIFYNGGSDEVPSLLVTHAGEDATLAECLDAAWQTAVTLLTDHTGDALLYLTSAKMDRRGNAEISFGYMVAGYPVALQEDAVRIEIEGNQITGITLHLRSYAASDKTTTLLPVLQAAAAVQSDTPQELFPGYLDDGSELLSPLWLSRS